MAFASDLVTEGSKYVDQQSQGGNEIAEISDE